MPNGYDKNWIRVQAALNGFRQRFGHWPSKVLIPEAVLRGFELHIFTPDSMTNIRQKLELVVADVLIVAEDEQDNQYNYGAEGFLKEKLGIDAGEWLGVRPDRPQDNWD